MMLQRDKYGLIFPVRLCNKPLLSDRSQSVGFFVIHIRFGQPEKTPIKYTVIFYCGSQLFQLGGSRDNHITINIAKKKNTFSLLTEVHCGPDIQYISLVYCVWTSELYGI